MGAVYARNHIIIWPTHIIIACMRMHTHAYVRACMCTRTYLRAHARTCAQARTYAHMHVRTHAQVRTYEHTQARMHPRKPVGTDALTHARTQMHAHMHGRTHLCMLAHRWHARAHECTLAWTRTHRNTCTHIEGLVSTLCAGLLCLGVRVY